MESPGGRRRATARHSEVHVTPVSLMGHGGHVLPASGGEGGIRTLETGVTRLTVFETAAFNRSATSPRWRVPLRSGSKRSREYTEGARPGQLPCAAYTSGSLTLNRVPVAALVKLTEPPKRSTVARTMASPSPLPG